MKLPVQTETVDMQTGEVTKTETVNFNILPAPAGTCPECAIRHDPSQPHNAQSLFYQYSFYAKSGGRWPTWVDAMEHCSEAARAAWTDELVARGVDVAGGKLAPQGGGQ